MTPLRYQCLTQALGHNTDQFSPAHGWLHYKCNTKRSLSYTVYRSGQLLWSLYSMAVQRPTIYREFNKPQNTITAPLSHMWIKLESSGLPSTTSKLLSWIGLRQLENGKTTNHKRYSNNMVSAAYGVPRRVLTATGRGLHKVKKKLSAYIISFIHPVQCGRIKKRIPHEAKAVVYSLRDPVLGVERM